MMARGQVGRTKFEASLARGQSDRLTSFECGLDLAPLQKTSATALKCDAGPTSAGRVACSF
jgi:hypothetical protein